MTDELQIFTINPTGRIVVSGETEKPQSGPLDRCCCRNEHQPLDGYIYTDPGCKVHGLTRYRPTRESLEDETNEESRNARAEEIRKQIIRDKRTGRGQSKLPIHKSPMVI